MNINVRNSRIIVWLAGIVILIIVILLPVGYFFVSYQSMSGSLEAEADINSNIINQIISANPDFWEFEQVRIDEYLSKRPRMGDAETRRIFNLRDELIAESPDVLRPPVIVRKHDLMDSGTIVGRLEISRSLRPLLTNTLLLALFMGLLGGLVFYFLYTLPIQAINRAEEEKERLIQELKIALANIKTLSGMLPICSVCKKIRDDQGYWKQVETYITEHSEALFTHSVCPVCFKRKYPEIYDKMLKDEKMKDNLPEGEK